jgi:hypothetical protein
VIRILAIYRAAVMAHKTSPFYKAVIHHEIFDKAGGGMAYVAGTGDFYVIGRHPHGAAVVMTIVATPR